jgi:hypothetical protein
MQNLAALTARRTLLSTKLAKAQAALTTALDARQRFLLDGDVENETVAAGHQNKIADAQASVSGFEAALSTLSASIAEVEAGIENDKLLAARKAASEALATDAKAVENKIEAWLTSSRAMAAVFDKLTPYSFEGGAVARYLSECASQIEIATPSVLGDVAATVANILSGAVPLPVAPQVPIAVIKVAPLPPTTKLVFTLVAVKFLDENAHQRKCASFIDCEMPLAIARRAIELKAACEIADARRRQYGGKVEVNRHPPLHLCVDLDDPNRTDLF